MSQLDLWRLADNTESLYCGICKEKLRYVMGGWFSCRKCHSGRDDDRYASLRVENEKIHIDINISGIGIPAFTDWGEYYASHPEQPEIHDHFAESVAWAKKQLLKIKIEAETK